MNDTNNNTLEDIINLNPIQDSINPIINNPNNDPIDDIINNDIKINIRTNPLIFHHNYDKYKEFNVSKKVLAPNNLLYTLSGYENIKFPIYFKINDTILTVHEFYEDIDCLYIPTELFYDNQLEEYSIIEITILKDIPPKGEYIKLKPNNKEFYEIQDIKSFLENNFKKFYASLHKYEEIKLPYYDSFIDFTVTECEPSNIISLNEIEELKIDFEPMDKDYSNNANNYANDDANNANNYANDDANNANNDANKSFKFNMNKLPFNYTASDNGKKTFIPFSGKGRRLCD